MIALLLAATISATVLRVIDGDTIVVSSAGIPATTVRLIGVNTPETHHPTKPVQPCGPEAEAFTRAVLIGKAVRLEGMPTPWCRFSTDRYGRVLAYVWVGKVLFNRTLIMQGWSAAEPHRHPRREEFRRLEAYARAHGVGLWDPKGCAVPGGGR